ncbi:MAG: hypothetical protein EKK53_20280 [Burkholderiales bacterium]|nr:MAG: hypothetical protein EKK53_20280 [Burkholderiales bacterium]
MRRTPPVVVQVQPQRAVQSSVAAIAAVTAAVLAAWGMAHVPAAWPALAAVPVAAAWGWREAASLPRRLRWDGEAWWLTEPGSDDETRVHLDVLIDLDHWLLLRAAPGPVWLPLARSQQASTWGALRATLYAAPSRVLDA